MSNSTDCLSTFPSTTPQFLTPILTCQTASSPSSPFCWPPNNTRICIPLSSRIPVFWPPSYYPPNSLVSIAFDTSSGTLPGSENVGNQTLDIGRSVWDQGVDVQSNGDGGGNEERRVRMYMRTRPLGSNSITNHEGPSLILVKVSDFPSPSPSSRPKFEDKDDDGIDALTGLSEGGMAGVIVGIVLGIIALVTGCCCLGWCTCCGVQRGGRMRRRDVVGEEDGIGKAERRAMVGRGVELEMKNVGEARGVDGVGTQEFRTLDPRVVGDEVGVVGERRDEIQRGSAREVEEPPPKYTP